MMYLPGHFSNRTNTSFVRGKYRSNAKAFLEKRFVRTSSFSTRVLPRCRFNRVWLSSQNGKTREQSRTKGHGRANAIFNRYVCAEEVMYTKQCRILLRVFRRAVSTVNTRARARQHEHAILSFAAVSASPAFRLGERRYIYVRERKRALGPVSRNACARHSKLVLAATRPADPAAARSTFRRATTYVFLARACSEIVRYFTIVPPFRLSQIIFRTCTSELPF